MISPERIEAMQGGMVRLMGSFGISPADTYPVFDRLVAAYSTSDRHYHTLEHLAEMFKVAGKLADHTVDGPTVQLAIWFHDAIYDSRSKTNEAESADLARTALVPLGVPGPIVERVVQLILATDHQRPLDGPDADVLLDADLAILSADPKRYARYAADVRREYAWVPDADYRQGRIAVLRAFLSRPRLYRTPRMFDAAETAARANLEAEIESLHA